MKKDNFDKNPKCMRLVKEERKIRKHNELPNFVEVTLTQKKSAIDKTKDNFEKNFKCMRSSKEEKQNKK